MTIGLTISAFLLFILAIICCYICYEKNQEGMGGLACVFLLLGFLVGICALNAAGDIHRNNLPSKITTE